MSNGSISKITLPNNSTYDIKDISARIAINKKIFIDGLSAESLCALHISEDDFFSKVTTSATLSNELYIVSSDYVNAYGQQIKNLLAPTDLSDAATKEYVDNAMSGVQIPTDLSSFTNSPGYLVSNDISNYYKKTETSSSTQLTVEFAKKLEAGEVNIGYDSSARKIILSAKTNITSVDCNDFIKDGMLSSAELCGTTLVLKFNTDAGSQPISVQMSSFVDNYDGKIDALSNAIDNKITIDDRISGICEQTDLSIIKLLASDYEDLVATSATLSNALYIVEDEYEDAYGQQIKNVAPGTDLSDAVNLEQLSNAVSSIQIPTDLSSFTNSPGYTTNIGTITGITMNGASKGTSGVVNLGTILTAHQSLSNYYTKSETSSSSELSNALSAKADLSSIEHVVQYQQDLNGIYTAVTIGSRSSNVSTDIGPASFVQGSDCIAVGSYSYAEGRKTIAFEDHAHAEGNETSATNVNSHAEGYSTLAAGTISHAEGSYTSAFGDTSHTEGGWTSTGEYAIASHAEGGFTRADGPISHVEGVKATAEISDYQSFVWQGTDVMPNELTDITPSTWNEYKAHGPGTFNINPVSGAAGVYIGEQTLASMLGGGSSRYALETAQLVSSGGSLTCAVNDQAITTIQVSSSTTPVVVQLPAQPADGARDFILRIEISSSTAPTFTFNGVNETIDFDSENDDWAVMEPGLNLVSFTETKRGVI